MAVITPEQAGGVSVTWFMDLIGFSEGTTIAGGSRLTKNDGYDVNVTGVNGPSIFTDYSDHPQIEVEVNHKGLKSSAAGRYQIESKEWNIYKVRLSLPDFSPLSQDLYCLEQLKERHAVALILSGNVQTAIEACSNIWASFPGNNYGQGGRSMSDLVKYYDSFAAKVV
jgi:muramidase (phage lysozyme)